MSNKIDVNEFDKRLHEIHPNIIRESEYFGYSKDMDFKCNTCGYEWHSKEARSGIRHDCPNCAKETRKNSLKIIAESRLKSEEQFRKELKEKQPNLIPNDTYIGNDKKYHCICSIHNIDVYKTPGKYLIGQGCQLCAIKKNKCATRYTDDSYSELLRLWNPTLIKKSCYCGIKNRINIECSICGYNWSPISASLVGEDHVGCPNCAGNAIKTPKQFKKELSISHPYLILLTDYVRANIPVKVYCTKCKRTFKVTPNKLQQGQHCICVKESHGEFKIRMFLHDNNVEFEQYKTFDDLCGVGNRVLSYDFFVPNSNLLIEFQGEQHDHPVSFYGNGSTTKENLEEKFKKQQEHDRRKREYACVNNFKLLEIWYYDLSNIDNILSKNILVSSRKHKK